MFLRHEVTGDLLLIYSHEHGVSLGKGYNRGTCSYKNKIPVYLNVCIFCIVKVALLILSFKDLK